MKIKIDIDCKPAEARAFFGLPDLEPMQAAMIAKMQAQMEKMDASELMKLWMPAGMESLERMQKAFMSGFAGDGGGGTKDK